MESLYSRLIFKQPATSGDKFSDESSLKDDTIITPHSIILAVLLLQKNSTYESTNLSWVNEYY